MCRRKILRIARDSFEEKGYYDTSMNEIAQKAEVSVASLFNYFPTKLQLIIEIEHMKAEDFSRILEELSSETYSYTERLFHLLQSYLEDFIKYPRISYQISEFRAFDIIPQDANTDLREHLFLLIQAAVREGELAPETDVTLILEFFLNLGYSIVSRKISREKALEMFRTLLNFYRVQRI
ncbi:MAG: TetR/AcrR family transcriptional regulator [Lachnospiraceae bacterium]|nr:TetR/AcrR family transcriptional regulator [Lachnospiraceae bacterium]